MTADTPTLLDAALGYAARGWPVFPCNPKHKQPLLASDKDEAGNSIRGTGGVSKASTDADQIRAWWKRWPKALIGLATGHPTLDADGRRLFVVDFDPRCDEATGEVWELAQLKADFEALIGCELPMSAASMTPSDGVHLYLLQDEGEPIRNSASKWTDHVDVRGLGGYVIAPPGIMAADAIKGQGGLRYRWHREMDLAIAPDALLTKLRERKAKAPAASADRATLPARSGSPATSASDAVRKYALTALDGELQAIRRAMSGKRNHQLNESAFKVASLVAAGALDQGMARAGLEAAARDNPGNDDDHQLLATIDSGWSAGIAQPRDLSQIEAAARERSDRSRAFGGSRDGGGRDPSDRRPPAPPAAVAGQGRPFRSGSAAGDNRQGQRGDEEQRPLTEGDKVRLRRIAECWLTKRLDKAEGDPDAIRSIAFGAGCRIGAGILDEDAAVDAIKALVLDSMAADVGIDEIDQALQDGFVRGFDPWQQLQDLDLSRYPLTDFGIAERFRDRFGGDFKFTTAKGWLGWDGRRWKLLDQDKDTPPAELVSAVYETIRAIQREAKRVADTGTKWNLVNVLGPRGGMQQQIDDDGPPNPHAVDYYIPKGKSFILFSEALAAFGRQAETAGKPAAIGALARRWLTCPIEQFDCEQMAINVMNGTLRFQVERLPDGKKQASVQLHPHRRDDLITRLAPVDYDREATSPLYDGMIRWAQPDDATRRYLHQVGGYSITGDTGEHLLWFHYGRGRNGKSVTIDSWASSLGDYSGTIGVESLLDQGIKKRGDAATPDLAKLGGVRLLRASEPERGAKLNAALVKMATGGEPMSVRALHKGFFDLLPRFKLQMSGNIKPAIPDTDDGIWGRMKLVPWQRHIEKPLLDPFRARFPEWHEPGAWPTKDRQLGDKIKAKELPGVFLRLVNGLVDYLEHGFAEPDDVTAATEAYRDQSDPLQRFINLCCDVSDPKERAKSSELHDSFTAWCKAVGEKEWSPKGFSDALIDKGFTKVRSDGMRWEGLKQVRYASDFLDENGNVRPDLPDLTPAGSALAGPSPTSFQADDDDLPIG